MSNNGNSQNNKLGMVIPVSDVVLQPNMEHTFTLNFISLSSFQYLVMKKVWPLPFHCMRILIEEDVLKETLGISLPRLEQVINSKAIIEESLDSSLV